MKVTPHGYKTAGSKDSYPHDAYLYKIRARPLGLPEPDVSIRRSGHTSAFVADIRILHLRRSLASKKRKRSHLRRLSACVYASYGVVGIPLYLIRSLGSYNRAGMVLVSFMLWCGGYYSVSEQSREDLEDESAEDDETEDTCDNPVSVKRRCVVLLAVGLPSHMGEMGDLALASLTIFLISSSDLPMRCSCSFMNLAFARRCWGV